MPDSCRVHYLRRRAGVAPHDLLDDLILVDGHVHGLSYADVRPRASRFISQCEKDCPASRAFDDLQLLVLNNFLIQLHGHAGDHLHLPGGEGCKARRGFFDGPQFHLLDGRGPFPVILIGLKPHIRSLDPFHELVGTCPDGFESNHSRIPGLRRFLVHDIELVQVVGEPGDWFLGLDNHGVVVDDVDGCDALPGIDKLGYLWV